MIFIRNLVLLFITLVMLCACTDKNTGASDLRDLPNSKTRYITLKTVDLSDDGILLNSLEQKLHKDHFNFTKKNKGGDISFRNCDNNTIINVEGNGILSYYAESTVAEKGSMKNTYADFSLSIFTFENEKAAAENHKMLEMALTTSSSDAYCNYKAPTTLLHRDNKIYYFVTRANMFETHTVKYANYIKNFQP
jgi:hypothetical protein